MELFKSMTGLEATYVPYRGSLPAVNDVAGGHVPMMFCDLGPMAGALAAGKVRPLGISSTFRVAAYPDIPPLAEVGLPGFNAVSWQMIVAPAKTPRPIVDKLHQEMVGFLATQEAKDQIEKLGFVPIEGRSVEGLQDFVKSEIARWGKVVRDAGFAGSQ
jgi:tripartite-type tricarboxylate transporter receptor subunit TctC